MQWLRSKDKLVQSRAEHRIWDGTRAMKQDLGRFGGYTENLYRMTVESSVVRELEEILLRLLRYLTSASFVPGGRLDDSLPEYILGLLFDIFGTAV